MKKSILVLLFFTAIFTTSFKCKKELIPPDNPYGLPNATQTGKNIFAYLNNGVPKITKKSIYTMGGIVRNDTLGVFGGAGGNNYFESITINVMGGLKEGNTYFVEKPAPGFRSIWVSTNKDCFGPNNVQHLYSTTGSVIITKLDTTNKIISGLFNCKIPIPNCDTLHITEGRFDIKY